MHQTKIVLDFLFISYKQLSESIMPRVCSLYNPSYFWQKNFFLDLPSFSFHLSSFSFIWYMGTYPRLIISFSSVWNCMLYQGIGDVCFLFFILFLYVDEKVRLITELSITSVTSFIS